MLLWGVGRQIRLVKTRGQNSTSFDTSTSRHMCSRGISSALATIARGTTRPVNLHPSLASVSHLLGRWRGEGRGFCPEPQFSYIEELKFQHFGKPYIAYTANAINVEDKTHMRAEAGFLRVNPDENDAPIQMTVADPGHAIWYSGMRLTSSSSSSPGEITIELTTRELLKPFKSPVAQARRILKYKKLNGNLETLESIFYMKLSKDTNGKDEHPHLRVQYVRVGDDQITAAKLREEEVLGSFDAIIDTREEDEFDAGSIPGARNFPLGCVIRDVGNAESDLSKFLRNKNRVLVYCKSGYRSKIAQEEILDRHMKDVVNLSGGWLGWVSTQHMGLPQKNKQ